jgi:hypothetical protein
MMRRLATRRSAGRRPAIAGAPKFTVSRMEIGRRSTSPSIARADSF